MTPLPPFVSWRCGCCERAWRGAKEKGQAESLCCCVWAGVAESAVEQCCERVQPGGDIAVAHVALCVSVCVLDVAGLCTGTPLPSHIPPVKMMSAAVRTAMRAATPFTARVAGTSQAPTWIAVRCAHSGTCLLACLRSSLCCYCTQQLYNSYDDLMIYVCVFAPLCVCFVVARSLCLVAVDGALGCRRGSIVPQQALSSGSTSPRATASWYQTTPAQMVRFILCYRVAGRSRCHHHHHCA